MYVYVCVCVCVCVCVYIYIYIYMYICMYRTILFVLRALSSVKCFFHSLINSVSKEKNNTVSTKLMVKVL